MARKALALLLVALVAGSQAEWEIVAGNVMTVAFGVSATTSTTVYLSGGDNGSGASVLKSTDGGVTLNPMPHDLQMMYLSVDMAKHSNFGLAGSLGFYGYTAAGSITTDGETLEAYGEPILFSASQSVVAVDNTTCFMIGFFQFSWNASDFINGVQITTDAGETYSYVDWKIDNTPRYGAASDSAWVITGGMWATAEAEHAIPNYYPLSQHFGVKGGSSKTRSLELITKYGKTVGAANADEYSGVIAVSTDKGQTWRQVYSDVGRFYFNGVHCLGNNCWAVAEGPSAAFIFSSTDGGFTWALNSEHAAVSLMDIEFSSATEGWAVGGIFKENTFDALFLHTTDGGVTWVKDATVPNAYPNGITLTNNGVAYSSAFMRNGLSSLLVYHP